MFSLQLPKGIFFGTGTLIKLKEVIQQYGNTVLVITGNNSLEQSGHKNQIKSLLTNKNVIFKPCKSDEPTIKSINSIIKSVEDFFPDFLIGIGGGSVLDTAKAVSGLFNQKTNVEDYLEGIGRGYKFTKKGLPWIAVPTTSGTGAEVTQNSVIRIKEKSSDFKKNGFKKSMRSPFLIADYAIVDPALTYNLPLYQTGISGMDALSQLLESYLSKKSNRLTSSLIIDAFPKMMSALKILATDLKNTQARENAAYGSLISGIALANSGLGAVHGFASGLGGMYNIPHGLICASFLLPVIEANMHAVQSKLMELLSICKYNSIEYFKKEVNGLLEMFEIKNKIKKYKISELDLTEIIKHSKGSSMSGNPVELTEKEQKEILKKVLF